jgi:hypothetical protein
MGRGTLTVPCLFMVFSVSSGKFLCGSLIILQSFLSIDFHISLLIISRCVVWHILKLVLEKDGNQLDRSYEEWKEYCKESRRKGTFCIQKKEGRLTGVVTCWVRCHLKNVIQGKIHVEQARRPRSCTQLLHGLKGNEKILEFEGGSAGSHSVENSLWKRLRTCLKTFYMLMRLTYQQRRRRNQIKKKSHAFNEWTSPRVELILNL